MLLGLLYQSTTVKGNANELLLFFYIIFFVRLWINSVNPVVS